MDEVDGVGPYDVIVIVALVKLYKIACIGCIPGGTGGTAEELVEVLFYACGGVKGSIGL